MAFPTYPANGQVAVLNGIQYTYTSATNSWSRNPSSPLLVTTSNAVSYTAATSPPASGPSLLPGALWYNTLTDILYKYTYDGVNYVWVDEDSATVNVATGVTTYTGNNTTVVSGTLYINSAITTVGGSMSIAGNITNSGNLTTSGNLIASGNIIVSGGLTISGNITNNGNFVTGNIAGNVPAATSSSVASSVGYLGMPQNNSTTNYTLTLADIGKQVYISTTSNVTIPANSSVPFPIGTAISIITGPSATSNVFITTDTMYLAGNSTGSTGTRILAQNSMAGIVKVASTQWIISGAGLT
jgi:hypothetical protein